MSIRKYVQLDHGRASLRYRVTATQNGKPLHEGESEGERK